MALSQQALVLAPPRWQHRRPKVVQEDRAVGREAQCRAVRARDTEAAVDERDVKLSLRRDVHRYAIMGLGSNAPTPWPLYIMFPLYFIRQIVDVSSHLLWFALFADCVPPEQRARWEAFLPFVGAGTSITTGIGGKWIDSYGYGTTFIMTACGQAVPILLLATILPQIGKAATVEAKAKDEAKVMM